MKRDPLDFEQRLQQLRPAEPRPEVRTRLENIAVPARPQRTWIAALRIAAPLAAAAALVLAAVWSRPAPQKTSAPVVATPEPVGSPAECLLGARELGIYHAPDGRPYRIVQGIAMSQEAWRDPADGRLLTRAVPQQKLLLVSMASL